MMSGYNFNGGGMVLMLLGMVLSIALLVVLVWVLINWFTRKSIATVPASTPSSQSALEILQQRYARGEIDTATFESMREQLGASPRSQFEKQTTAGGS